MDEQDIKEILGWLKYQPLETTSSATIYQAFKNTFKQTMTKTAFSRLISPYGYIAVSKRFDNKVVKIYRLSTTPRLKKQQCTTCLGRGFIEVEQTFS